jgi:hypothetical protein
MFCPRFGLLCPFWGVLLQSNNPCSLNVAWMVDSVAVSATVRLASNLVCLLFVDGLRGKPRLFGRNVLECWLHPLEGIVECVSLV